MEAADDAVDRIVEELVRSGEDPRQRLVPAADHENEALAVQANGERLLVDPPHVDLRPDRAGRRDPGGDRGGVRRTDRLDSRIAHGLRDEDAFPAQIDLLVAEREGATPEPGNAADLVGMEMRDDDRVDVR